MGQEDERQQKHPSAAKRAGPLGLGFRVPLVITSPWSRGGYVNSQVCGHTSILQLLKRLFTHRTGQTIREPNIRAWRRTLCGDLSSAFRPYHGEKLELPKPVERDPFLGSIHQAQFRQMPSVSASSVPTMWNWPAASRGRLPGGPGRSPASGQRATCPTA